MKTTDIHKSLDAVASDAVQRLINMEHQTLGDHCLPVNLREIVLGAMSRACTIVVTGRDASAPKSPAETMAAHIAEFGR